MHISYLYSAKFMKLYNNVLLFFNVYFLFFFFFNYFFSFSLVKVEEDTQTPRNSTFSAILENQYRLSEFVEMEINILKFYNWEVLIPTAVHFIDYYSLFILCSSDAIEGESVHNSERIKICVQKYMEYFQNMILLGKFIIH